MTNLPAASRGAAAWAGGKWQRAGALVLAVAVGTAIALAPLAWGIALVLGGVLVWIVARARAWLVLYVAAFPLQGVSLFGVQAFGFRPSHVFFLVTLVLFVFRELMRERPLAFQLQALDMAMIGFVAWKISSAMWSVAAWSSAAVETAKLVLNVAIYFTMAGLVMRDRRGTLRRLAVGFGCGFVLMAALTLYNLAQVGFKGLVAQLVLEAATGSTAINTLAQATSAYTGEAGHNIIASWEVLGLMLIWGVVAGRWRQLGMGERSFWYAAVAAAAVYIVLSLSRTAWLSLVVGSAVLWWRSGHRLRTRVVVRTAVAVGLVSAALFASGFAGVLAERARAAASITDYGVTSRFDVWNAVLARFIEHPIIGVGVQGTEAMTREMTIGGVAGNPHNVYVQVLAELGLVGAVLFALLVGCLLWGTWRLGSELPVTWRLVAWGLFAAIASYLVQCLTQYDFMDLGIWTLMGVASGMLHAGLGTGVAAEDAA